MIPDDRLARIEAAFAKHFPVEAAIASMMPPDPTPPGKCPACEGHGDIWTNWSPKPVQCGHCHGTGMIEADPTPARTVGENGVAVFKATLVERRRGGMVLGTIIRDNIYLPSPQGDIMECRDIEPYVAFPKDEAEALRCIPKYAQHHTNCDARFWNRPRGCTCGLQALLDAARGSDAI